MDAGESGRERRALMTSPNDLAITLPRIARVGIADLHDVAEHRINTAYGSISHYVRFHNGGVLRVAYAADGSLLELSGEGMTVCADQEGTLSVKPYQAPGR